MKKIGLAIENLSRALSIIATIYGAVEQSHALVLKVREEMNTK